MPTPSNRKVYFCCTSDDTSGSPTPESGQWKERVSVWITEEELVRVRDLIVGKEERRKVTVGMASDRVERCVAPFS